MQFPFRARRFLPGLLLIALGFAQSNPQTPAPAASGAEAAQPAMVLKVTSRLVVVDVVATDKHGAPITDLKQDEFAITEDEHEQKITTFSFLQSRPGLTRAAAPPANPNVYSVDNVPRYSPNGALNVLLLDALNTTIRDQKNAHLQMLKLLAKLPTDRPIAVFALGAKLRLLQGFTTDPMAVKGAVESFTAKGSPGLSNPTGGAAVNEVAPGTMEVMADLAPQMAAALLNFQRETVAAQTDLRVQWTIAALKSLARALGGYPGRKNLIWISDSFPSAILPENIDTHGNLNQRDYQADIERMTALLNDAQIAVYPVDARTLIGNGVFSDLSNTDSQGGYMGRTMTGRGGDPRTANMGRELNVTGEELQNARSTMNTIAERTGGRAFYNTNNLEGAIRQGMEDGATYYTLGYVPDNKKWDGKFRTINVKISRKDVKLHFRAGYYAVDPEGYEKISQQQRGIEFGQAVNLDYPIATALPFRAQIIPPSDKTKGRLLVYFGIDPRALSWEQQADGNQHALVDCAMQVYSADYKPVKIESNEKNANLAPDNFKVVMQKFFPCDVSSELAPGDYWLRLAVRDARTGLIGSANAQVKIAAATNSQP